MPWKLHLPHRRKPPSSAPPTSAPAGFQAAATSSGSTRTPPEPVRSTPLETGNRDLWDEAYKALNAQNPRLVKQYEETILLPDEEEQAAATSISLASIGSLRRQEQLSAVVASRLKTIEDGQKSFELAGRSIAIHEQMDKVVKTIVCVKDFVSSAVSAEPHAALAWAGVCVLLPLLLNPTTQQDAAIKGFESIPFTVRRYILMERLRRPDRRTTSNQKPKDTELLIEDLESKITELYSKIFEYQIRLMSQYHYNWAVRFGRDVFKADDWTTMMADVLALDKECSRLARELGQEELEAGLREQNRQIDELTQSWHEGLEDLRKAMNDTSAAVNAHVQEEQTWRLDEKAEECLHALRANNVYENQKERTPKRLPGTCTWFLNHPRFHRWREEPTSSLLWVSANPGCGKSVLSKSLVEERLVSVDPHHAKICYFFFKDVSPDSRSITKAFSAILHQLFSQMAKLTEYALPAYRSNGRELPNLFSTMWSILIDAAADPEAKEVICVLDGLDECEEAQQITLIETVKSYYSRPAPSKGKLRILLTSRPYRAIQSRFHSLVCQFPTIHLSGDQESDIIKEEIDLVIRAEVSEIASERCLDSKTEDFLLQRLLQTENRTYLWLYLILDQVRNSDSAGNPKAIQKEIESIPQSVSSAYEAILNKVKDKKTATKCLHIIVGAQEPLSVKELNVTMSIEDDSKCYEDLNLESTEAFEMRLRSICGLFVYTDQTYVFLIHQTAKDFLVSLPDATEVCHGTWEHSLRPEDSNFVLTKACVTFLLFNEFGQNALILDESDSAPSAKVKEYCKRYPFLEYAASYWMKHLPLVDMAQQETFLEQTVELIDTGSPRVHTWFCVAQNFWDFKNPRSEPTMFEKFDSLTFVSKMGLRPLVKHLLSQGVDVNARNGGGATALHLAVTREHEDVIKMLLGAGADIEAQGWYEPWRLETNDDGHEQDSRALSGTPLWLASVVGNIQITRILLDSGADVNAHSLGDLDDPGTPLLAATTYGTLETMHALLDYSADVNLRAHQRSNALLKEDRIDYWRLPRRPTPLQAAVCTRDTRKVRLLLEHGADVNAEVYPDDDVHPDDDVRDDSDYSDYSIDAKVDEDPVEDDDYSIEDDIHNRSLKSEASAEDDCMDNAQRTEHFIEDWKRTMREISKKLAIHLAVNNGLVEVVRLLLQHGATTNLNVVGEPTVLHLAAMFSYDDGKDLYGLENMDVEEYVTTIKKQMILRLLEHVGLNAVDRDGNTALDKAMQWNEQGSNQEIILLLLERGAIAHNHVAREDGSGQER